VAIRLRDEGHDDRMIAVAIGIDEGQVPTLLRIADSKLANLMTLDPVPSPRPDRTGAPRAIPATAVRDEGASS
jgi:hypothetical protein